MFQRRRMALRVIRNYRLFVRAPSSSLPGEFVVRFVFDPSVGG